MAKSTKTILGIDVHGEWEGNSISGSRSTTVGGIKLSKPSFTLSGDTLTGSSGSLDVQLFDGFSIETGKVALGLADGATVRKEIGDAPVSEDHTYLYLDADGRTELDIFGLGWPLTEGKVKIYISPDDPSIYVSTDQISAISGSSRVAKSIAKFCKGIDEATVGFSRGGHIPWTSTVKDAKGERESFHCNVLIAGTFTVKIGALPLQVVDGSMALQIDDDGIERIGICGTLVIPGFSLGPFSVDFPLGEGVLVGNGVGVEFFSRMDSNAWDDLAVPVVGWEYFTKAMKALNNTKRTFSGQLSFIHPHFALSMTGDIPLGPFDAGDGGITLTERGLSIFATCAIKAGPLKFCAVRMSGGVSGPMVFLKGTGSARVPGFGKTMTVDFTLLPPGQLVGGAEVKLFGNKLKGSLSFSGLRFRESTISAGFNLSGLSKGKLTLTIKTSDVKLKASCKVLGKKCDVSVGTDGKFKAGGIKFKL